MKKLIAKIFLGILVLIPILAILSFGASQGPNSPTAATNDATVGTVAWNNLTNSFVSDDSKSSATVNVGDPISNYNAVTGFNFSIPSDSKIVGVLVEVEEKNGSATGVKENSVKLIKGGTISGNEKSTAAVWPSVEAYIPYGSLSDLWGLTLTPSDVNSSNFGVGIAIERNAGSAPNGGIDHIRMTVYYVSTQIFNGTIFGGSLQ